MVAHQAGENFTEFYILGPEGKAADYPRELTVGEQEKVTVGIINRESRVVSYRVEVMIEGVKNGEDGAIVLEHEEKWEGEVSFAPEVAGENQKVEFLLFKEGESEPYSRLYLWLDVKEAG